jgi:hypothetical protein
MIRMTGNCFEVAGRMILNEKIKEMLLCHGIVTGKGKLKNKRIIHAWIEINDVVIDFSNSNKIVLRKDNYYKVGKIKEVTKYTQTETAKLMLRNKHFGPWK